MIPRAVPAKLVHLASGAETLCGLPASQVLCVDVAKEEERAQCTCAFCKGALGPAEHVDFGRRFG